MSELIRRLTSRRRLGLQVIAGAAGAAAVVVNASADGAQPHMEAALRALNNAAEQLNAADPDKGGHREKAMGLVRDAIGEVKEGMHFAERH